MAFLNKTVYMVPVWYDSLADMTDKLLRRTDWEQIPTSELDTAYLISFAHKVINDPKRFISFRLKENRMPEIHMFGYLFEEKPENARPELTEIRLSCFGTGVGFLELFVTYGEGMTVEDIENFAYKFKKAAKPDDSRYAYGDGKPSLDTAVKALLPDCAEAFFGSTASFKRECYCFHMVKVPRDYDANSFENALLLLRRNYNTMFVRENRTESSKYEMRYAPYAYDQWGGSQVALVNLVRECGHEKSDYFLNELKPARLLADCRYMYLLLLNQRFSAIRYIDEIAESDVLGTKQAERLNGRIVNLKTAYSFRVISDDLIYQNVYSRMYQLLDIDNLLADIQDNEEQLALLQSSHTAKNERMASKFLFGISLLSLFSALIDAAGYFERFPRLQGFATGLSIGSVSLIVLLCVFWLMPKNKK